MSTQSLTGTLTDANLFEISGPFQISYSTTSITGRPLLSYRDAEFDLSFSGAELDRTQTSIGELVTVTVDEVVDAFVRRITLLVPKIRLEPGDEQSFDTLLVESRDTSGAFVPAPGPDGVLQHYRVHQVRGTAQVVAF
jgi:hypothetical protein